jgi:mannose-6-phosphate isomerase-like protein (cupin superfamily)
MFLKKIHRIIFFLFFFTLQVNIFAQQITLSEKKFHETFDNIYSEKIAGDSLSTSFLIIIKKEVKLHKHLEHSEHVYVLEGEGDMQLGNEWFKIKKGDLIFIPKNTAHKVVTTSEIPLKVISIQSPQFDGTDRILLE